MTDIDDIEELDAVVIGAGISGLYSLYCLRERLGLSVRVFEEAPAVGGTWYWNSYPGARFDSESWSYGYSFSEELLQDWTWKEHFAGQPEIEGYLNHVADRFDLRRDIEFDALVTSATWEDDRNRWLVETKDGRAARGKFLIPAVGLLSAPYLPEIPGLDTYEGEWYQASRWPRDRAVDFKGKRVGVIGTGSTGVQVITEVAKVADRLTVFQRTPGYVAPLRNSPIEPEVMEEIRGNYEEIFRLCGESPLGFVHNFDPRSALEVTPEERTQRYAELWEQRGFAKWLANFRDVVTNAEANATFSDFFKDRIRERVHDPAVAEQLIPHDHGFGMRRPPMESGYFEVFNQPNVKLVNIRESPIEGLTPTGIKTTTDEYELDTVIFATGFDMMSGPLLRFEIRGEGGRTLKDHWSNGPRSYLGVQPAGFPNMFFVLGAARANVTRAVEMNADWVAGFIADMIDQGYDYAAATAEAEDKWVQHSWDLVKDSLSVGVHSYLWGTNIPGKPFGFYSGYTGGLKAYREICEQVAADGYEGFRLESRAAVSRA